MLFDCYHWRWAINSNCQLAYLVCVLSYFVWKWARCCCCFFLLLFTSLRGPVEEKEKNKKFYKKTQLLRSRAQFVCQVMHLSFSFLFRRDFVSFAGVFPYSGLKQKKNAIVIIIWKSFESIMPDFFFICWSIIFGKISVISFCVSQKLTAARTNI